MGLPHPFAINASMARKSAMDLIKDNLCRNRRNLCQIPMLYSRSYLASVRGMEAYVPELKVAITFGAQARSPRKPRNTHNSCADLSLEESSNNWLLMGGFSEDAMG